MSPENQMAPSSQSRLASAATGLRRAGFLDRDGVINRALEREAKPYPPRNLAEFEILPEVPGALARLKAAGFLLIVATNQPDVGRGTLQEEVVESIHAHMLAPRSLNYFVAKTADQWMCLLRAHTPLGGIYICGDEPSKIRVNLEVF